jgi:hypothetical protein
MAMETANEVKPDQPRRVQRPLRWIAAAVIVLGSLLLAAGGPLTAPPLQSITAAYLTDRNLALAVILLALLVWASRRTLGIVVLITAAMHGIDAVFDVILRNVPAAAGSVVFAVVFLLVGVWLLRDGEDRLLRRE